jgi:hypothetical protein
MRRPFSAEPGGCAHVIPKKDAVRVENRSFGVDESAFTHRFYTIERKVEHSWGK